MGSNVVTTAPPFYDSAMAYDEGLADRIREIIGEDSRFLEKKMFGGLAFLLNGKMSVGINGSMLMTRCRHDLYDEYLKKPHVREMDFTGRSMKGFLYVEPEGIEEDADLAFWIDEAKAFLLG